MTLFENRGAVVNPGNAVLGGDACYGIPSSLSTLPYHGTFSMLGGGQESNLTVIVVIKLSTLSILGKKAQKI